MNARKNVKETMISLAGLELIAERCGSKGPCR
jgi:hypothetical protein